MTNVTTNLGRGKARLSFRLSIQHLLTHIVYMRYFNNSWNLKEFKMN